MPRRFALALIAIILIQFGGLYAWQKYEHDEDLSELSEAVKETNRNAILDIEEMLDWEIRAYEERMMDDAKARFIPLLRFVTKHHAAYERLTAEDNRRALHGEVVAFIKSVGVDYENMMMTHYQEVDLHKDDAVVKCAAIKNLTTDAVTRLIKLPRDTDSGLRNDMARLITLNYLKGALTDAIAVCASRALIIDQFFPVFNADRCAYQTGDFLNARVSIGSYSSSLDPANVKLTVDGKELTIGPDGTAKFNAPAGKRGEHTLETKVVVTNPLTGEVKTGEGRFIYRVF